MAQIKISVQEHDFSVQNEYQALLGDHADSGAVVSFIGLVRDFNDGRDVTGLKLEHYPGMTEKALNDIATQAAQRWSLNGITIIHRVGQLQLADQIVLVAVSSAHRGAAFQACEFVMDYLKTKAPFWKKETTQYGEFWVQAKSADDEKANRW
ncbi:molybdopterin synthase catalytic subunit MoaE [Planctobacterium marinum]|uniref:Molybdopterin synthase catalytic subunit n=1 Tax=Planctobacterium marinum TaxID=1631968 RepID=A0AA48KPP9_9ALTE|nr:molybdopterin guanine dinucleotide biosynthesis protein MoaE [Planctobacterium marinum]